MDSSALRKPAPALALAIGLTIASHKANANAARALGIPSAAIGVLVAAALVVAGLRSG
jgi:hypothetical protein